WRVREAEVGRHRKDGHGGHKVTRCEALEQLTQHCQRCQGTLDRVGRANSGRPCGTSLSRGRREIGSGTCSALIFRNACASGTSNERNVGMGERFKPTPRGRNTTRYGAIPTIERGLPCNACFRSWRFWPCPR